MRDTARMAAIESVKFFKESFRNGGFTDNALVKWADRKSPLGGKRILYGNLKGKYSFTYAQDMAELRKERMKKPRKLLPALKKKIISMLEEDFSPQQIRGRLRLEKQPYIVRICYLVR